MNTRFVLVGIALGITITIAVIIGSPANPLNLDFGGMDASLMKRMKELEDENRRLKKMYIEEKLIAEIARDIIEKKL
jgi:hypothetical protein